MSLLSIVHEFAVLYSSRVLQKDKRWSDGRLRYYELNNKLEVFSDDMLLVSTDFYPHHARKPLETGVFDEGAVYVLPSGKLILEFNEYFGSFERDLSTIFAKRDLAVKKETGVGTNPGWRNPARTKTEDTSNKLETCHMNDELSESGPPVSPSSKRLNPTRGRPIGLRKRPKISVKAPKFLQLLKDDVSIRLDASFHSAFRYGERIPPGSNRLSTRLRHESGLFLIAGGDTAIKDFEDGLSSVVDGPAELYTD
ncbi:hypothetical protein HF325_001922 [Metschnikowia pulcherrima]|uniref:5'-3' DNA helicase ZGRF1-like N-terminal domain-containing protein n=1 Tax=Metschnikowia pulcherrima TaxID=27326 RepID=A0A8H7GXN8_9ASCO|nr:hypothetical protein HF325_001922 [Metschnikowia pulcherrima]